MMIEDSAYERALFKRVAKEDQAAFREIFTRYKEPFYAAALKMTRCADTAEEIVQNVFVGIWVSRSGLAEVESPSAYLFASLYHDIYRHFREQAMQRKLRQQVLAQGIFAENPTEEALSYKECESTLSRLIGQLPRQQQLVYRLSRQDGLSREEIARKLDISPNTVKNHLLRALKHIREQFHYPLVLLILLFR